MNTNDYRSVTIKVRKLLLPAFISFICLVSCQDKLDIKPDKSIVVPSTLRDFQGLLDNTVLSNANFPVIGEAGADNYYLLDTRWNAIGLLDKNVYIWEENVYPGLTVNDWNSTYGKVFYSNVILEGLAKISSDADVVSYNNVKGSALFARAHAFYLLAQLFCKTYDKATAATDLGIPLRLESDVNASVKRASVEETYNQILDDLLTARELLPPVSPYKTRPGRNAADAMLARVYLVMGDYDRAMQYADLSLEEYSKLLDYSQLDSNSTYPVPVYNDEVIFHGRLLNSGCLRGSNYFIDTILYGSYAANDLRKTIFFKANGDGRQTYRGSYIGSSLLFGGIAVDELFLIRAECYARTGDVVNAMKDLNKLLSQRYITGTFIPLSAANAGDALRLVLSERRKELVFRGLRWTDLRRLNKEAEYAVTLTRRIDGTTYKLPPLDARYVYPIPDDEMELNEMEQNIR